jgi:SAM-dependent methyltransferase
MVRQGAATGAMIARAAAAWPDPLSAAELFGENGLQALDDDHLLLALLTTAQNTDLALERFFTLARRALLDDQTGAGLDTGLAFRCALAQQCFINEYVFFQEDDETARAQTARAQLAAALEKGGPIAASLVAAVACYVPLSGLPRLLERSWPAPLAALLTQQISEPAEERRLALALPAITPIEDAVSQKVRAMYEENPYPRWVKAPPPSIQDSIGGYLRRQFPRADFSWESKNASTEFLSAGCGTGHLALEFPQNIKARMLAVDLSRASLAYAKRKSDELGLTNITFAQADLQALTGHFDAIESSGVLHHMADPLGAWRHLLTLLDPGGFMLVGLYSEAARQGVVRMRQFIAEKGYGSSAAEIRRARQDMLALEGVARVTNAADFFGISTCRDLLFHVQETRFTLGDIAGFLQENNLTLLGFEMDSDVLAAYRHRFPEDPAATDLVNWQAFEAAHPDTFISMYNFWVQKSA